jgi:hypothetical protein
LLGGGELSLLLSVCGLRGALGLLVLLAVSLVNSLRDSLATDPLFHLGSFALSRLDCADQTVLCLRRALVGGQRDQWATCDPRDVLLLARREVRRHLTGRQRRCGSLTDRSPGREKIGRAVSGMQNTAAAGPLIGVASGQDRPSTPAGRSSGGEQIG